MCEGGLVVLMVFCSSLLRRLVPLGNCLGGGFLGVGVGVLCFGHAVGWLAFFLFWGREAVLGLCSRSGRKWRCSVGCASCLVAGGLVLAVASVVG